MGTQKRIAIMIHIMSPEIFPMFTEAIGDIIFIGSTVLPTFQMYRVALYSPGPHLLLLYSSSTKADCGV